MALFQLETTFQVLDYQLLETFHLQIVAIVFIVCKLLVLNMLFKKVYSLKKSYYRVLVFVPKSQLVRTL